MNAILNQREEERHLLSRVPKLSAARQQTLMITFTIVERILFIVVETCRRENAMKFLLIAPTPQVTPSCTLPKT